jgi:hypothetical protein
VRSGTGPLNYESRTAAVPAGPSTRVVVALVLCGLSILLSVLLLLITCVALAKDSMAILGIAVFGWTVPAVEAAVVLPAVLLLIRGQPGRRHGTRWSWVMMAGVLLSAAGVAACWRHF